MPVPDIGSEARRQRRRVKRKDQHPDPGSDQRLRAGDQIAQGKAFGGESNPANRAKARQGARSMESAHRSISTDVDKPSRVPTQKTDIGARMRNAQDRRRAVPETIAVIRSEIRSPVGTEVTQSDGAEIQAITEILEYR